jgi:acetophenone carboxylase
LVGVDLGAAVARAGGQLLEQAQRDLRGEGFDPAQAQFQWTLEDSTGQRTKAIGVTAGTWSDLTRSIATPQLLRLEARFAVGGFDPPERVSPSTRDPLGTRPSALATSGALPIHAHDRLYGQSVTGPLAVDGGNFTWFVGAGWTLAVDTRGDADLRRA